MDNKKYDMNSYLKNPVFVISLVIVVIIAVFGIALPTQFSEASNVCFSFLTTNFGWMYLLAVLVFVGFLIFIAVSKWGKIKLGGDDSKPEYSTVSWFAMLFGAGMGVGLVFWGVSEPLNHFASPVAGIEPMSQAAADFAMKSSFMHWGFEPWACYAIIGLGLAYFQFRKNKPGLISAMMVPLFGEERMTGWLGKLFDILAVFATVAGIVTSIGLGVLQINGGLNFVFGVPNTFVIQIAVVVFFAVIYIGTAVSGVSKGIKILGDINLYLAIALMALCFIIGPTLEVLNNLVNGLGGYLNNFISDSLALNVYGDNSWYAGWRIFYWAWFIAWAPFVGIFIARISKGRTIREFIIGVMAAPAAASFLWFAIFGSLGLHVAYNGTMPKEVLETITSMPELGLFATLQYYPIGKVISVLGLILLCTFFITSANTGVFTLSMLTSAGDLNPPKPMMVFWGVLQAVVAVCLLMAGGLKPLQTISIVAAFPFIFIMIFAMISFVKALRNDEQ